MKPTKEQIEQIRNKCHLNTFLPYTMAIIVEKIITEWEKIRGAGK